MNSQETMLDGLEIGDTIPISKNRVMSLDFHNFSRFMNNPDKFINLTKLIEAKRCIGS